MTTAGEATAYARTHGRADADQAIRLALRASGEYCRQVAKGRVGKATGYGEAAALLRLLRVLEPHAKGLQSLAIGQAARNVIAARQAALGRS